MRTILALAFIALLAGAFAHKSKAPIEESKLVSALKGLFQLAAKDELEDVADVLAHVREEIESTLARIHGNYDDEEAAAEDVISYYRSNLADLVSQIEGLEAEIANHEEVVAELQENIDSAVAAIEDATAQQANEEARRTDYHNAFRTKVDQLTSAVEAAEDALRLLQEIDTQDLSGSFLEINNKKIVAHFQSMHKSLHGMKLANSITPLTKMLVEVAAAGINHDLISQLEDLLNQLIEIIESEINAAVADDNNDDEYSRSTLANLQSTIDAQSEAAERNQAEVEELTAELETDAEWLSWLEDSAAEAKRHAEEAESAWEDKSGNYRALIRRLERDIEALEAAENFVDRD